MIKLYESVKTRWLEALRSGEYSQGMGTLASLDDDGKTYHYCCLGVAVHEFVPDKLKYYQYGKLVALDDNNPHVTDSSMPTDACIPYFGSFTHKAVVWIITLDEEDIQNILEVPEIDVLLRVRLDEALNDPYDNSNYSYELQELNDKGVPFTVIADLIEKHAETIPDPE